MTHENGMERVENTKISQDRLEAYAKEAGYTSFTEALNDKDPMAVACEMWNEVWHVCSCPLCTDLLLILTASFDGGGDKMIETVNEDGNSK